MKVVTAEQIRELDRRAVEAGFPGVALMENAGRSVVDVIERELGPVAGRRAAVFSGGGNNGGDGFVIVRILALAGAHVDLVTDSALDPSRLKPDAAAHWKAAQQGASFRRSSLPDAGAVADDAWAGRFDFAVDALLGTGIKEAPRDWIASAIRALNGLRCPVFAVDIPSGVDADTGATPGEAVRATHTVTFALPKLGLFLAPGYEHAGTLHVRDIGFPWASLEPSAEIELLGCTPAMNSTRISCSHSLLQPAGWEILLQKRRPESNKGDYGHVGIIAGSLGMAGAPALAARAAQRAGAGLVTVLTARSVQPTVAAKLDEQMTVPLPDAEGALAETAWEQIAAFARKATLFCVGPGLTTREETVRLVHRILREIELPIVLDADGLNALAMDPGVAEERFRRCGTRLTLTPHPGEAARLLGTSIAQIESDRVGSVRELARRFRAVAVLKGRHTLIADPDGTVCINTTGNPGMATGGMGDALTGIAGALAAQDAARAERGGDGIGALYAAALAVHLHGIAGDIAAAAVAETGLTAGDLVERVPAAIASLTPKAKGEA